MILEGGITYEYTENENLHSGQGRNASASGHAGLAGSSAAKSNRSPVENRSILSREAGPVPEEENLTPKSLAQVHHLTNFITLL